MSIGKTLAHYEITSRIGKGDMGEVYQAKDRKLGRDVAGGGSGWGCHRYSSNEA